MGMNFYGIKLHFKNEAKLINFFFYITRLFASNVRQTSAKVNWMVEKSAVQKWFRIKFYVGFVN